MLTFFRKIRKALLDSGSTGKYLLYATGEILLVVVGILIALSINDWSEYRKNRVKEDKVLIEISKTIEGNIALLNRELRGIESFISPLTSYYLFGRIKRYTQIL